MRKKILKSLIDLQLFPGKLVKTNFFFAGIETLKIAGGLHNFMNWKRALLTDSGGFQMVNFLCTEKKLLKSKMCQIYS